MIDLTPIEIRKKKGDFSRSFRGYESEEVDLFLELAADRLEAVITESRDLESRLQRVESQLAEYRAREEAMTAALVSAEALREEVRQQAQQEAELIRREARAAAEEERINALRAVEQEQEVLRRLRARRVQVVESFRQFLERELMELAAHSPGPSQVAEDIPADR